MDAGLFSELQGCLSGPYDEELDTFLTCIATCHTATPLLDKDVNKLTFLSPSEDETAFLLGIHQLDYTLTKSQYKQVLINKRAVPTEFHLKALFPFDSTRKMMSTVFKNEKGEYIMMCKGAETTLLPRLKFADN